jgi:hypothetical protein
MFAACEIINHLLPKACVGTVFQKRLEGLAEMSKNILLIIRHRMCPKHCQHGNNVYWVQLRSCVHEGNLGQLSAKLARRADV